MVESVQIFQIHVGLLLLVFFTWGAWEEGGRVKAWVSKRRSELLFVLTLPYLLSFPPSPQTQACLGPTAPSCTVLTSVLHAVPLTDASKERPLIIIRNGTTVCVLSLWLTRDDLLLLLLHQEGVG